MSELRNELQRARETYHAARYPGDLAADVTFAHENRALRWLAIGVAQSAIAAAIILAWVLWRGPGDRTNVVPVTLTVPPKVEQPMSLHMPPMPAMPSGVGLTLPGLPQIPSLDALRRIDPSNSTTQEAV